MYLEKTFIMGILLIIRNKHLGNKIERLVLEKNLKSKGLSF